MSETTDNRMAQGAPNIPAVRAPERRVLRAFAFDPMSTRLSGRYLTVDVPFEPDLRPGPVGALVHVVDYDGARDTWYQPVDLDDPSILAQGGLRPSEGDPRTHQQVVYAVSMSVIERFERFMGRRFRWRSDRALRLVPHAFEGRNAFFDPQRRAVLFGYFRADRRDPGPNLPGQMIFTCLSMDIIAHEVTHAIVHRQRRYYTEATNPDVFAWHEAIADLVALFHHFTYPDVVADAVAAAQTDLQKGGGLLELAREFGESTGRGAALRNAIADQQPTPERFLAASEPHERGACFVAAVFDAFLLTYRARIADLLRIATGGSGVLPPGRLHPDLVARVADEAVKNAERFLGMVIRAFDYLPVVDVTFGDVVRAIVTADRRLYPDDAHLLRSSLVEALRRRGIYPGKVTSLTDEALAWPRPAVPLNLTVAPPGLDTEQIDLSAVILSATQDLDLTGRAGDLSSDPEEQDQAAALASMKATAPALTQWARAHAEPLGLDPDSPVELHGVHVAYRQAADRQPRPELILQFAQRRRDLEDARLPERHRVVLRAGTTVIAGVDGTVEYLVPKPLPRSRPSDAMSNAGRRFSDEGQRRLEAIRGWLGRLDDGDALNAWTLQPASKRLTFANLHAGRAGRGAMAKTTVAVRMYNMGFGDAFRVTVRQGRKQWRMLVDCGVHSHGAARPLTRSVEAIVADLAADGPAAGPKLDVVVATHHHADHIAGFALDPWEQVEVAEVWVPFVEDRDDPDAIRLRQAHTETARRLEALVASRTRNLDPGRWPPAVSAARAFALNSLSNADAMDRLLARNGRSFANQPPVRYLPDPDPAANVIGTGLPGVQAHILGPSRDPAHLKRMDPPLSAGWLTLDPELDLALAEDVGPAATEPLFNPAFELDPAGAAAHPELLDDQKSLRLDQVSNDAGLLAAAALLEQVVNNTSVFFVLDVRGTHLVFPGDAQQGAWEHVLEDAAARELVRDAVFYKIGHHGSHNGTPRRYIEEVLEGETHAMLSWGLVKRWRDTIPKTELLEALDARHHVVTRSDAPVAQPGKVTVHEDLWSEVTFEIP